MQAGDAIAEILKREGVSTLFCYPTTPLIERAVAAGLRPVLCRQERVGVDMADGFARVTNGKPVGVFAMQYGPGAENAFPGVATAFSDSTPVLFLPLGHARDSAQVFPLFKSTRTYASVTKSIEDIVLAEHVPAVMRRAFSALKNGRLGPVMVEVPRDVVDLDIAAPFDYHPIRPTRSAPDPNDVEAAARLLLDAACPLILAGQGVLYAEASEALVQLAELLQAPVMTTVDGKSGFPEDHALALGSGGNVFTGQGRHFLHERTDLVLAIGCGLNRHQLTTPLVPPGVRIIHATNDPRDLHKSYATELALLGDAALAIRDLIAAVKDRLGRRVLNRSPEAEIAEHRGAWLARWADTLHSAEAPINPYRVMAEFTRVVDPAGAIVTHDSGSPRDQLLPFYRATRPRGYLGCGKSHQLGTGLGLTIGAKIAAAGSVRAGPSIATSKALRKSRPSNPSIVRPPARGTPSGATASIASPDASRWRSATPASVRLAGSATLRRSMPPMASTVLATQRSRASPSRRTASGVTTERTAPVSSWNVAGNSLTTTSTRNCPSSSARGTVAIGVTSHATEEPAKQAVNKTMPANRLSLILRGSPRVIRTSPPPRRMDTGPMPPRRWTPSSTCC